MGGNVHDIIHELKTAASWEMKVQRPIQMHVTVAVKRGPGPNDTLGLDVKYAPNSKSLLITDTMNGPLGDWNSANPDQPVFQNDRICEINGARGEPQEMIAACAGAKTLTMLVIHYRE